MEFLKSITAEKAHEIIGSFPVAPVKTEYVPIENACGRVLATGVTADIEIPSFSKSLVDGFALAAKETYGAKETNPAILRFCGEIRIGREAASVLNEGNCIYVSTGSMIPPGSDAVIMQEYTKRTGEWVEIYRSVHKGENIYFKAEDGEKGDLVFSQGRRLSPFDTGVLAYLGLARVPVARKPVVGIISTGDEIIEVTDGLLPGRIRDVNRYTVMALLGQAGADAVSYGIARDVADDLSERIESARACDLILLSGGSSKGERDLVSDVVENLGGKIHFHGIGIKPGKPTIFAELMGKPFFGLPGHPASCATVLIRFVLPLVSRLQGALTHEDIRIPALTATNIPSSFGIEEYIWVDLVHENGRYLASPRFGKSPFINHLAVSSGYIVIPAGSEGLEKDEPTEVYICG